MKTKQMDKVEFAKVANRDWARAKLVGYGRPLWMKNIPDEIVEFVLASGTFVDPRLVEFNGTTYSGAIGGIDVYRYDQDDLSKGYPYNKDHYIIVLDPSNNDALLVHGPLKDHEHWIEELPDLPDDIIVIESTED